MWRRIEFMWCGRYNFHRKEGLVIYCLPKSFQMTQDNCNFLSQVSFNSTNYFKFFSCRHQIFLLLANNTSLTCHPSALTYSMVQSLSWEANWSAASQETPRISWNPKVHYRTHNRPLPASILGQPNPVHIHTSHLLEIRSNIIRPSMPRSPQWSPSLWFPHQDPIYPLLL